MKKCVVVDSSKSFELKIDNIASDKSISHRCAIFSLLCEEMCTIENFLEAEDTLNSLKIAQLLGAKVDKDNNIYKITPPKSIVEPSLILDCGNAGTAMRLYIGLLSSQNGFFVLSGDCYLNNRPMARVVKPLREIGAKIDGRDDGNRAPIAIRGRRVEAFDYSSQISSAQVKSAMILAALNGKDRSYFSEPELSRDHSERMLRGMGAEIIESNNKIEIIPTQAPLKALKMRVPSDPSSAFFFAVAAAITKNSKVVLEGVLLNKSRIEAFRVLERMGVDIEIKVVSNEYEEIGDIVVAYNELKGVEVDSNISWLIDEIPALSIAMAFAEGRSVVKNAQELRVKESDRIKSVVENLKKCGAQISELEDGFEIIGKESLQSATIDSYGDHRIAMSFAICGLRCGMRVEDVDCINTSFPNFFELLDKITDYKIEE